MSERDDKEASVGAVFSVLALNPSAVFWWQFILLVQQADFSGSLVSQEDIQVMHVCAKISWVAQKMHSIIFALLMDSCANELAHTWLVNTKISSLTDVT